MNQRIMDFAPAEIKSALLELDDSASKILTHLGIFPNRRGHAVLKGAILYGVFKFYKGITGDMYAILADLYDCPKKTAEGNIRSALRAARDSGMLARINGLLGVTVTDESSPLSNLQFISLIAQHLFYAVCAKKFQ